MASRFWVGGTGTWDATDTSHWAASTGGTPGETVPTSADTVTFDSNSGTAATVTVNTNPAVASSVTINKTDLTLLLSNTLTVSNAILLTTGTFNSNGQTFSCVDFYDGGSSSTKVVSLGSSSFTASGSMSFTLAGLTWSANTATANLTNAAQGPIPWQSPAIDYNGMSVVAAGAGPFYAYISSGGCTVANFTRTGTDSKADTFSFGGTLNVTGTFTVNGYSATKRLSFVSNASVSNTVNAANTSLSNVDFHNFTAGGAAAWTGTSIGNGGGNAGTTIGYQTPTTRYAIGPGNWDDTAIWSDTSTDGTGGATVPLCHDDVVIDANTNAGTISVNATLRLCADLDCTGYTGTLDFGAWDYLDWAGVYGSITAGSGMTISGTNQIQLKGVSSHTITSNGQTWPGGFVIGRTGGGTYTLADALTISGNAVAWFGQITLDGATTIFSDAGYSVTFTGSQGNYSQVKGTLNASGTWTIPSTVGQNPWTVNAGTVNASTSTINISGVNGSSRTIQARGGSESVTYGTVNYTVAGSTGALYITANNIPTFGTINFSDASNARSLVLPATGISVTKRFNVQGSSGKLITLTGDVSMPSGTVAACNYLNLSASDATGGGIFYAGANSTNGGSNTGWLFTDGVVATSTGGNWSSAATWIPAVVPAASTNVHLDSISGNVTVDTTGFARSLDCDGYTGTFTHSNEIRLGDASAGTNNVLIRFSAAMGYPTSGTSSHWSSSGTQQTITLAGKTLGYTSIGQNYPLIKFLDTFRGSTLEWVRGELDTNSQTVILAGQFYTSGSVLTLGSSAISIASTSNQAWYNNYAALSVPANTATITLAGGFTSQAVNYNGLSIVMNNPANITATGAFTVANLTRNGTAVKTDSLTITGPFTVTGTATFIGNSPVNRLHVLSNTLGTSRTITLTGATVSNTNVDFTDITFAGSPTVGTTSSVGNALGNSGITFTTPVNRYGVVAGNWSSTATWSDSDGGSGGFSVPLCHDDVYLNSSSGAGTYAMDMPRACADLDCTGFTRTLSDPISKQIYGSITFGSGMGNSVDDGWVLMGRGTHTITSNGSTVSSGFEILAPGGSYTMNDAVSWSRSGLMTGCIVTAGTFSDGGFTMTLLTSGQIIGVASGATVNLTGSWISQAVLASGNVYFSFSSGATVNASTASFSLTGVGSGARTFEGGGKTFGTLTYTVAGSTAPLTITGQNTFGVLNIGSGRSLSMPTSSGVTVTNTWNVSGAVNGYIYLPGVSGNYLSTPDSSAVSITGDIDLRCAVAMDDWTPGQSAFISKYKSTGSSNRAYEFGVTTSGYLYLLYSPDGSNNNTRTATSPVPASDGAIIAVRATMDVDNGASQNEIKFWTKSTTSSTAYADSLSNTGWSQLGSTVTTAGTTSIFQDDTQPLAIGIRPGDNGQLAVGKFYSAIIKNGIDGTLAFGANIAAKTVGADTFIDTSANAATITVNGQWAKDGDGRVTVVGDLTKASGSVISDYLVLSSSDASGGAAFYAGSHSVNGGSNTGWSFTDLVGLVKKIGGTVVSSVKKISSKTIANVKKISGVDNA
jgi:hypothetical protein